LVNCNLGKNGTNTNADIGYPINGDSKLTLKGCNLYSTTKVNTTGIDDVDAYLISYNQDNSTGTAKIWGDYHISDTQKFNYADLLYSSTVPYVNSTMKGTGSMSNVTTDDGKTLTELWEVKCTDASVTSQFAVKKGTGAVLQNDGTATEETEYTSSARGVKFTVQTGDYQLGDVFYFVTVSSSGDKNVQKEIEFNDSPIGTKLTVDNAGEIQMLGTSSNPTIVKSSSTDIYYGFFTSGTVNLSKYEFSNLKSDGLVINPSATVLDLSSGTFDKIENSAEDSSYIRVSGITSNKIFSDCVFNDTTETADYNVKANGVGISWTFFNWSGIRAGEEYDYEINEAKIRWDISPPSAISNLTALEGENEGEITLKWTAPGDDGTTGMAVTYEIKCSTTANIADETDYTSSPYLSVFSSSPVTTPLTGGSTEVMTVTGLIPGTTYYFAIKVKDNADCWSAWTSNGSINSENFAIAYDTNPAIPADLAAEVLSTDTIKLTWTANNEADFKEYELEFSSYSESAGWQSLLSTTALQYNHTGLENANTYYYHIRSWDETSHKSEWASVVSTYTKNIPPEAPDNFSGVAKSTESIEWNWNDNAINEDGYRVKNDTDGIMKNLPAGATFWLENNLSPNASYYRYAEAHNEVGTSTSNSAVVWTLASEPETLNFVSAGIWTVTLNWTDTNNPTGTRYGLSKSTDNFVTNISTFVNFNKALTAKTTVAYGLTPDTTYWFRVWAYNGDERATSYVTSGSTKTQTKTGGINIGDVVINEIMYDCPPDPLVEWTGEWIELYNTTDNEIDLSGWVINDLNSDIVIPAGTIIKTKSDIYATQGCLVLTENIACFTGYDYGYELAGVSYVQVDQLRFGEVSDIITLSKNEVTISSVSYNKSWGGAEPDSGRTLEKIDPNGADDDANWDKSTHSTSWIGNWGTPGAPNSIYQDKIPPAAISNLTALTGSSEGTVKLKWTAPGNDGMGVSNAAGYLVKYASRYIDTSDFNASWVSTYSQGWTPANFGTEEGTAGNRVVDGLIPGATYWFAMKAKDAANNLGVWTSSGTDSTVNTLNWEIAYDTNPAAPSGFTALALSTSTIKVNWNANGEPDFNEYELEYSSFSLTEGWQNLLSTTGITFLHTNLKKNNTYYYRIKALDDGGLYSGWSSAYAFPKLFPPLAPSNFTGVAQSTASIVWSWFDNSSNEDGLYIKNDTGGIVAKLWIFPASVTGEVAWGETGLSANASYYRYVEYYNAAGPSSSTGKVVFTLANPPVGSCISSVSTTSVTLDWLPNGNPEYTRWGILRSADNFVTSTETLKDFFSNYTGTSYDDSSFAALTTYWYKVCAYNEAGSTTTFDTTISTITLISVPSAPTNFRITLSTGSISYSWRDNSKTETSYYVCTNTDFRLSPNLGVNANSWIETDLKPDILYKRKIEAGNSTGSRYSKVLSCKLPFVTELVTHNSTATVTKGGASVEVTAGSFEEDGYIKISTDPDNNPIEIDTTTIITAYRKFALNNDNLFGLTDSAVEFKAYNLHGAAIPVVSSVTISLPYPDDNPEDGFLDVPAGFSQMLIRTLRVYWLNVSSSTWERIGGNVDTKYKVVRATVTHFSVYMLIGAKYIANGNLSNVIVYPNPFKPNSPQSDYCAEKLTFKNLITDKVEIMIFNIAGELVAEPEDDGTRPLKWEPPEKLASGVYIYAITNPDNSPDEAIGKFAIIR